LSKSLELLFCARKNYNAGLYKARILAIFCSKVDQGNINFYITALRRFYIDTYLHDIPGGIFGLALSAIKKYLDANSSSCRHESNHSPSLEWTYHATRCSIPTNDIYIYQLGAL
jgi:hypothetical protein